VLADGLEKGESEAEAARSSGRRAQAEAGSAGSRVDEVEVIRMIRWVTWA
jgi:hypothetical protein